MISLVSFGFLGIFIKIYPFSSILTAALPGRMDLKRSRITREDMEGVPTHRPENFDESPWRQWSGMVRSSSSAMPPVDHLGGPGGSSRQELTSGIEIEVEDDEDEDDPTREQLDPHEEDEPGEDSEDGGQPLGQKKKKPPYMGVIWEPYFFEGEEPQDFHSSYNGPRVYPDFSKMPGKAVNIPQECVEPIDFFKLFYPDSVMQEFVVATNSYGRHSNRDFIPTDVAELHKLFAIILLMGLVQQPDMESYWSKENSFLSALYGREIVSNSMRKHRFKELIAYLHHYDLSNIYPEDRRRMMEDDPFFLVSAFVESLSDRFALYFKCGDFIDIDEMCIIFKGRHRCRVYNPNKPQKWHFKVYCLSDRSGYLHRFYLFKGEADNAKSDFPAATAPIDRLTKYPEYHDNNHILCTDNYFTSIDTLKLCMSRKIHTVGTCRLNRKGIPEEFCFSKKSKPTATKPLKMAIATLSDSQIYFIAWSDRAYVHLLSTVPPKKEVTYRKHGGRNGETIIEEKPSTSVTNLYNFGMKGTDIGDQLSSYYAFEHKSKKWPRRIFVHFLMVSLNNAKILYNSHCGKKLKLKEFLEAVIKSLLPYPEPSAPIQPTAESTASSEISAESSARIPAEKHLRTATWLQMKEERFHCPRWPVEPFHLEHDKMQHTRGKCRVCSHFTNTKCMSCNNFLCIIEKNGITCFQKFHTREDFTAEVNPHSP